eukprot:SAG11_NODE_35832_length_264_cov_3.042424_1_plen_59_part_00
MEANYNTVEWYLNGTADQKRKADDWIDKLNEVYHGEKNRCQKIVPGITVSISYSLRAS